MKLCPILSIITINYNNVAGLKRTVKSVINQSNQEFEYIVIDGGSIDGSASFIDENKIHFDYHISEPDNGIYNAMNKGILAAKGEYLLFLNSGDLLFTNNTINKTISILKSKTKDIFFGNIVNRDEQDVVVNYSQKVTFKTFFDGSLPHPSSFIRRSCFLEDNLYDEELKIVSDWKFFILGIFKKNFSFEYLDEIIAIYYLDGISSKNKGLDTYERQKVLKQEFQLFYDDYLDYQMLKYYFKKYKLEGLKKWIVCLKNNFDGLRS